MPLPRKTSTASTRGAHADSRLPQVLDAAAHLFCSQGFQGTTVRDIARAVGMLPGSLYCHFATKEDLLAAIYQRGVDRISAAVQDAVTRHSEPWARLEAASVAHLQAVLRGDNYARVVVRVLPAEVGSVGAQLVQARDRYEALWVALVQALPLPQGSDRRALRLLLLGALNGAQTWYRPDGALTPRALARRFVSLLRHSAA